MATSLNDDELVSIFHEAETPVERFAIGAESEKFGVHRKTGAPLCYEGEFSVRRVIRALCEEFDWVEIVESDGGPVLGARRGGASVTLEPGAQLELSGDAHGNLHQVADENSMHLQEIAPISQAMDLAWLSTGFHPTAHLSELPWVPKQRYPIMADYLPRRGKGGLDMMQRTCTTQGNFDWFDERDAMKKLVVALKLSPLLQAWFSNAPFKEGQVGPLLSHRGVVWQNMDPARSGLISSLWTKTQPRYEDYVQWALDAGMFLFRRGNELIKNTGQSFRDFMQNGYEGHRATLADFRLHLTTLFPEVRLKNTLEVRSVDALPPELSLAALAVWTGVLYDQRALDAAHELLAELKFEEVQAVRPQLCEEALSVSFGGKTGFEWAEAVFELAHEGLERRAQLHPQTRSSEACYLEPAREIIESRQVPAQRARSIFVQTQSFIAATEIRLER